MSSFGIGSEQEAPASGKTGRPGRPFKMNRLDFAYTTREPAVVVARAMPGGRTGGASAPRRSSRSWSKVSKARSLALAGLTIVKPAASNVMWRVPARPSTTRRNGENVWIDHDEVSKLSRLERPFCRVRAADEGAVARSSLKWRPLSRRLSHTGAAARDNLLRPAYDLSRRSIRCTCFRRNCGIVKSQQLGLKIPFPSGSVGSIPTSGTSLRSRFRRRLSTVALAKVDCPC